jgi:hypothetical protein
LFRYPIDSNMAVVLYQGGNNTGYTGAATASVGSGFDSSWAANGDTGADLEKVNNALESLTSKDRKKKYIGLAN